MIKRIFALFISLLLVTLSCGCWEEDEELKKEVSEVFSSFDNKNKIAKIEHNRHVSFYDHWLYAESLKFSGEFITWLFSFDGKLYFGTIQEVGVFNNKIYIDAIMTAVT